MSDGYWVAKATNGKDALYIADEFSPDVIVLDIMMPVMDGTDTVKFLEKNPRTKDIPVLFLTLLISKGEESRKSGPNRCFLAKPIEKDLLLKEAARWIKEPSMGQP